VVDRVNEGDVGYGAGEADQVYATGRQKRNERVFSGWLEQISKEQVREDEEKSYIRSILTSFVTICSVAREGWHEFSCLKINVSLFQHSGCEKTDADWIGRNTEFADLLLCCVINSARTGS
jgi:hypothetical protein